jgi:hypothetical protein
MAAARQAVINASVQHQLMDLVRTHQDQSKRLTALEESRERLRSAAGAILDRSTQTQTSRSETKRIISSTSQGNLANILSKLCDRDDNTQKFVAAELAKLNGTAVTASASSSTARAPVAAPLPKRKVAATVSPTETCKNCTETYYTNVASVDECCYHPGMFSLRPHSS